METRKGVPGIKQTGKIAHYQIKKHLAKFNYQPCHFTTSLWRHKTRPISFTLVVKNFGIKYVGKQHAQHLINALQKERVITVVWSVKNPGIGNILELPRSTCHNLKTKIHQPRNPQIPTHTKSKVKKFIIKIQSANLRSKNIILQTRRQRR